MTLKNINHDHKQTIRNVYIKIEQINGTKKREYNDWSNWCQLKRTTSRVENDQSKHPSLNLDFKMGLANTFFNTQTSMPANSTHHLDKPRQLLRRRVLFKKQCFKRSLLKLKKKASLKQSFPGIGISTGLSSIKKRFSIHKASNSLIDTRSQFYDTEKKV